MKTIKEFLKSIGLIFIVLWMIANNLEQGDTNAATMYFVVFTIPLIIVSILNGLWLNQIEKLKTEISGKRILSLIPVLLLITMIFMKKIPIPYFDGAFGFIGIVGGIGIGINNLIWNFQLKQHLKKEHIQSDNILDESL